VHLQKRSLPPEDQDLVTRIRDTVKSEEDGRGIAMHFEKSVPPRCRKEVQGQELLVYKARASMLSDCS
jgi:hypothetical protein